MGCCFFALIGALWPRIALAVIWLFFPFIPQSAFQTTVWPVVGFFFLPTTTLAYELVKFYTPTHSIDTPLGLVCLAVGLLHDMGQLGGFRRRQRQTVIKRERFVDPG